MRKFIVAVIILVLVIAGWVYYYQQKGVSTRFLEVPVQFTAYAYSIDGLEVAPFYQDPQRTLGGKRITKKIPDDLFQPSVNVKEKLFVLDQVEVRTDPSTIVRFYLVKTGEELFGYIPDYRLAEKDGTPLASPSRRGAKY